MKMKTTIVLHDVYCVVTYPEYLHVRNRYYKNHTSFKGVGLGNSENFSSIIFFNFAPWNSYV
jgi:hypothetical protein